MDILLLLSAFRYEKEEDDCACADLPEFALTLCGDY